MLWLHGLMVAVPAAMLLSPDVAGGAARRWGGCLCHRLFGWDCPACGVTRSAVAVLRGHWGEAFAWHPAGPLLFGLTAIIAAYLALALAGVVPGMPWSREAAAYRRAEGLALALLAAGWAGKIFTNSN